MKQTNLYFLFFFSGSAFRYQVNSFLRKRYATLEEAEDDLQVNYFCGGLQDIQSENSSTLTSPGNINLTPQARLEKNTPLLIMMFCYKSAYGDDITLNNRFN